MTNPQTTAALNLANKTRLAGANIKHQLKTGQITVTQALADPAGGCIPIPDLLRAQPRWGPIMSTQLLEHLHINETRRVRDLTPRQRRVIAEACQSATTTRGEPQL